MMGRGGRELVKGWRACQDLNLGTSSLLGFCTRACFPRIAPATCATMHRWRPLELLGSMACGPDTPRLWGSGAPRR